MNLTRLVPHHGVCYVCGESTLIAFEDPITRKRVGKCCAMDFDFAGRVLKACLHLGFSHPTEECAE